MSADLSALPIIDLSKLDNPETRDEFYKELRHVARDIGFFYVKNHGIPVKQREELQAAAEKFFALPQDEKNKIDIANSRHFRGYTKAGDELTRNKPDYREQIDFGHEAPAASEEELAKNPYVTLYGPNQFPDDTVPELRDLVLNYLAAARALTIKLLRAFLVALEQPENSLDELITGEPYNVVKLVHYPGMREGEEEAIEGRAQGVGPHRDNGILTLLYQDSTGGLQVETEKGQWIDVPPVDNTYVINIGEVLELATDGYLRANVHQVVMKDHKAERYSIPYFLYGNLRAKQVPLLTLSPELKARSRGISSDPLNPMFGDVGKNSLKARLRSHPAVTQRWYPEEYKLMAGNNNNIY